MAKSAPPANLEPSTRDEGLGVPSLIGAFVLVVLGWFAWRYYLERTACFDSAFFSWLMIDEGAPVSVLGRYGSWIAQLLPVLLIKLGAPLKTVLRAYSLAFILFHGLVFYLVAFRLKDRRATIALPIVLTAAFHYMFYFGISELYQGLSLSVLLWVFIRRAWTEHASNWWFAGAIALNVAISFYHQLLVLPLVFMLVFEAMEKQRWRKPRVWGLGIVLVLWYVLRITLMTKSTYEEARMPKLDDLITYGFRLDQLNSTIYFLTVWTKFKALLLVMALAGSMAVWHRSWLRLIWSVLFSAGFIMLILIVDHDGMAPVIYENYYPVIGLVWSVLFATEADRTVGLWRKWAMGIGALACALGLLQIHRGHYRLTDRVEYAQRLTTYQAERGSRKSLVRFDNYPWAYGLVHWAVGMESALCSGVQGPQRAATIFVSDNATMLDSVAQRTDQFLGPVWQPFWFGIQNLDRRYFDLPRDVGYSWANVRDTINVVPALRFEGPAAPYRMVPDRFTVVPIGLYNPGSGTIRSCTLDGTPRQFVYELYRVDGSLYQKSAITTSLEVDIAPAASYIQGLVIERPVDRGTYTVRAWLVHDSVVLGPKVSFQVKADAWPF